MPDALLLGAAMLGFQFSIGAVNDLVDEALDARTKPCKADPRRTRLAADRDRRRGRRVAWSGWSCRLRSA